MDAKFNKIESLKVMVQNVFMPKLQELRRCFREELKSYCKPNFNLKDGTSISTEELLSNGSRLICMTAESGYGKTSFTKFLQLELLSKIENAGYNDLGSLEIPIRISCRSITGRNVSDFLEDEIPLSRPSASSTLSLENFLKHFDILWIIDGYDERTAELTGFFMSFLETIPSKHKIIVTSRLNSLKEVKYKLEKKNVCLCNEVSIEGFNVQQIKEVARKYLGFDKALVFEFSILSLNDKTLEFLKNPIILSLCLELWSNDATSFDGKPTSIYQLHDMIFEKYVDRVVQYHIGKINVNSEEDLKCRVKKWFSYLCQVVGESTFSYELRISDEQKRKLTKKAKFYGLNGTYCLSTFFNSVESSVGTNYFVRHKTQKEVLSCVYLKECDDDALKAVVQQPGNDHLFEYNIDSESKPFRHLEFLMECCNGREFTRIFVPLLEIYSGLQHSDCLLQIKDGNLNCFDALKTQFKASGQSLVLHVYKDDQVYDLQKVIQYLMPDLNSFKIKIDWTITMHKEINDFISKCKDRNSFVLKLGFDKPNKFVSVIQMFTIEGNQNLIKELDLTYTTAMCEWTEEMKKELFKLESLNFVSFGVHCWYYSRSMLHKLATEESEKLDSDVHPPQTASRPLQTPSSTSLAAFEYTTHLHFDIRNMRHPSKVFEDLVKVNSKFPLMSVDLDFYSESGDLPDNLLPRFLSSSVQVKQLRIDLNGSSKFPNAMKLVNSGHIETLKLDSYNKDELSSVSHFKSFFAICDFDKMNKIKEIKLVIWNKSPLKVIYNKLPSDLLNKTKLDVWLSKSSAEMEIVNSKQFKRIQIMYSEHLSASEIDQLRSISKSFIVWG